MWYNVGLGITSDEHGKFFAGQLFSSRNLKENPLTAEEFAEMTTGVRKVISLKHPNLQEDRTLSMLIDEWAQNTQEVHVIEYAKRRGYAMNLHINYVRVPWTQDLVDEFYYDNSFTVRVPSYTHYGIGFGIVANQVGIYMLCYYKQ